MNSVESPAQSFEWKIKFPDGVTWTVIEANQRVLSANSDCLGDLGPGGMDILVFLRRALHGGGQILSVKEL